MHPNEGRQDNIFPSHLLQSGTQLYKKTEEIPNNLLRTFFFFFFLDIIVSLFESTGNI